MAATILIAKRTMQHTHRHVPKLRKTANHDSQMATKLHLYSNNSNRILDFNNAANVDTIDELLVKRTIYAFSSCTHSEAW